VKVFSTITSPVFSEFIIVIGVDAVAHLPSEVKLFDTLRTMNKVRSFKLVFLLMGPDWSLGDARRKLGEALGSVTARGLLDFHDGPPAIRSARSRKRWWDTSFD
jgi:hypothetical protein